MVARLDIKCSIFRATTSGDDVYGGILITGILTYSGIPASITANMPSQVSLDQGLETPVTYSLTVQAKRGTGYISLIEDDELSVTWPPHHKYINQFFLVKGVHTAKRRRYRGHVHASLQRTRESRRETG